jgi:uncharacterized protein YllA (UPF0747 family)
MENYKKEWFLKNRPIETNEPIERVKAEFAKTYRELLKLAEEIDQKLLPVAEHNLGRILSEIDYIEQKMEHRVRKKMKEPLAEFDEIILQVKPSGILQERVWNIYQFANETGPGLVEQLLQFPYVFNGKHKILYL